MTTAKRTFPFAMLALAIIAGAGFTQTATAQISRVQVGVLTCTVGESAEGTSTRELRMACSFTAASGGVEERYAGTLLNHVDVNKPLSAKQVLVWAVISPGNPTIAEGALSQRYAIAAAARSLIGQSRALALESTNDGAEGITQLELTPA
jgi:hypothetical protein